jgi:hypothetical protein
VARETVEEAMGKVEAAKVVALVAVHMAGAASEGCSARATVEAPAEATVEAMAAAMAEVAKELGALVEAALAVEESLVVARAMAAEVTGRVMVVEATDREEVEEVGKVGVPWEAHPVAAEAGAEAAAGARAAEARAKEAGAAAAEGGREMAAVVTVAAAAMEKAAAATEAAAAGAKAAGWAAVPMVEGGSGRTRARASADGAHAVGAVVVVAAVVVLVRRADVGAVLARRRAASIRSQVAARWLIAVADSASGNEHSLGAWIGGRSAEQASLAGRGQ